MSIILTVSWHILSVLKHISTKYMTLIHETREKIMKNPKKLDKLVDFLEKRA